MAKPKEKIRVWTKRDTFLPGDDGPVFTPAGTEVTDKAFASSILISKKGTLDEDDAKEAAAASAKAVAKKKAS